MDDAADEGGHVDDREADQQLVEERVPHRRLRQHQDEEEVVDEATFNQVRRGFRRSSSSIRPGSVTELVSLFYSGCYTTKSSLGEALEGF